MVIARVETPKIVILICISGEQHSCNSEFGFSYGNFRRKDNLRKGRHSEYPLFPTDLLISTGIHLNLVKSPFCKR